MILRSEKGSALVMAIFIGLVATIFGTVLYQVSTVNAKQAQQNEDQIQANYFARAGVEMAIGMIKQGFEPDNPTDGDSFYGTLESGFESTESSNYNIKFTIRIEENNYIIESYGIVRRGTGQGSIATQSTLDYKISTTELNNGNGEGNSGGNNGNGTQAPVLDKIFAVGINPSTGKAIEFDGSAAIYGDTAVNTVAANSVSFQYSTLIRDGDLYIGPSADWEDVVSFTGWQRGPSTNIPDGTIKNLAKIQRFPLPVFPDFPDLAVKGDVDAGWGNAPGPYVINESGAYNNIDVKSNLTINIGNDDIVLVANSLNVSGSGTIKLNRTGSGRLILYVNNTFKLAGSSTINNNGDYNALIMYYAGSDSFDLGGSTKFVGSVYAQNSDFTIGGSGGITGHIITGGDSVKITGSARANVRAVYAPNASMELTGSGEVEGAVVAKDIKLSGSANIRYNDSLDTAFFDLLEWPSASEDSDDDSTSVTWRDKGTWLENAN